MKPQLFFIIPLLVTSQQILSLITNCIEPTVLSCFPYLFVSDLFLCSVLCNPLSGFPWKCMHHLWSVVSFSTPRAGDLQFMFCADGIFRVERKSFSWASCFRRIKHYQEPMEGATPYAQWTTSITSMWVTMCSLLVNGLGDGW